jgi:hypothetical protein
MLRERGESVQHRKGQEEFRVGIQEDHIRAPPPADILAEEDIPVAADIPVEAGTPAAADIRVAEDIPVVVDILAEEDTPVEAGTPAAAPGDIREEHQTVDIQGEADIQAALLADILVAADIPGADPADIREEHQTVDIQGVRLGDNRLEEGRHKGRRMPDSLKRRDGLACRVYIRVASRRRRKKRKTKSRACRV